MVKVLCLPVGVWKVIFFLLQFLNFGFFIGSLVFDVWFKQRWNYPGNIDSENYKGRLFSAKDHLVGLCDEGDSFKYCYDECRDLCDDLSSNKGDCRDFCDRFKYWYRAGVAYTVFDIIAAVLSFIIAFMIIMSFCRSQSIRRFFNLYVTAFFMIAVFLCHFLGFVVYAGVAKLKFHDCTHDFDYSGSKSVCAQAGAKFALFVLIWLLFIVPIYFIVARKAKIEEQNSENGGYQAHLNR